MNCAYHEQMSAVAECAECGKPLCDACTIHWKDKITCKHCLEKSEAEARNDKTWRMRKSPSLAGFLSLLPGAGQVYVGYYASGFINILVVAGLIAILAANLLQGWEPFFGLFLAYFWVFNIIDSVRRARIYNEVAAGETLEKLPTDSPLLGGILLLILGVILTLEITLGISMEILSDVWPLAILAGGIYLIVKYARTRKEITRMHTQPNRDEHMEQA